MTARKASMTQRNTVIQETRWRLLYHTAKNYENKAIVLIVCISDLEDHNKKHGHQLIRGVLSEESATGCIQNNTLCTLSEVIYYVFCSFRTTTTDWLLLMFQHLGNHNSVNIEMNILPYHKYHMHSIPTVRCPLACMILVVL